MPPKKRVRPGKVAIESAVEEVLKKGQSIRSVASAYKISKSYLADIVKKAKGSSTTYTHDPNIGNRRIFSQEQEEQLAVYLKRSSKMCYGLTTIQVRELAYQFAAANKVAPEKWIERQKATKDWFRGFMKRNTSLSVRKPENTSLSRATSFNQENVSQFYKNLANILHKKKIEPHMIWNLDETGCSTVTNPPKVIATRGCKQVGQVTSAERGQLVTMLGFINASGGTIPPVFVFPRVHFKEFMLLGGPKGSLGLANPSGWITEESFYKAMIHFVKYVKPSDENPCLILCDNHSSHITIDVVTLARDNHITILTFPPHCSHRLQPLDVSIYGPFKARYREAMNAWMLSNPGKRVSIYEVAQFANTAYIAAFSMENAIAGFQKTGVHPFNRNTFIEDDFLSSFVTDRPAVELHNAEVFTAEIPFTADVPEMSAATSSSFTPQITASESNSSTTVLSPECIRPYPKALPRKKTQNRPRKMKSTVITDTPEKDALIEKQSAKKKANQKMIKLKTTKNVKKRIQSSLESSDSDVSDVISEGSTSDLSFTSTSKIKGKCKAKITSKKNNKNDDDDYCTVCKGAYLCSSVDWLRCAICKKWAHETCGIKGTNNYFCDNCN